MGSCPDTDIEPITFLFIFWFSSPSSKVEITLDASHSLGTIG